MNQKFFKIQKNAQISASQFGLHAIALCPAGVDSVPRSPPSPGQLFFAFFGAVFPLAVQPLYSAPFFANVHRNFCSNALPACLVRIFQNSCAGIVQLVAHLKIYVLKIKLNKFLF